MADTGMLFYDKLDLNGHIVERIEKFYPIPPVAECNQTTYGDFLSSLSASSIIPLQQSNLATDANLQCCDFYSNGLGYQFTICDQGVGVYLLNDRKGGSLDLQYLNMPFTDVGFNDIPWEQLIQEVDKVCNATAAGAAPAPANVTANVSTNASTGNSTRLLEASGSNLTKLSD
jgi:hypothetical protein